ncbi:uncharacterized protein LOC129618953 [Condylostylus longicornis]|uniref:uncharacterized protein LOC129618953 n=1 Tax=Condylostylus longicornis TaxID=2530218 RepID=UPI00244DB0B0|nr:uncharacterized protein LOC129618953 [Condylostylus longicornis]
MYGFVENNDEVQEVAAQNVETNSNKLKNCNENLLLVHLAKFYITSPERIIFLTTVESIDITCEKLSQFIRIIERESQNCIRLNNDNLYSKLYVSVIIYYENFCEINSKELQTYNYCLQELRTSYMDCEGPPDWYERSNQTEVCEIFLKLMNCYYVSTTELCGLYVANLMWTSTKDVFGPILPDICNMNEDSSKNINSTKILNENAKGILHPHDKKFYILMIFAGALALSCTICVFACISNCCKKK